MSWEPKDKDMQNELVITYVTTGQAEGRENYSFHYTS